MRILLLILLLSFNTNICFAQEGLTEEEQKLDLRAEKSITLGEELELAIKPKLHSSEPSNLKDVITLDEDKLDLDFQKDEQVYSALKPFTLDDAFISAIDNNPQFKSVKTNLDIGEAEIMSAKRRFNPGLFTNSSNAEDAYRLGISKTFELGGKRGRRIDLAKSQKKVISEEVNKALLDLRYTVRGKYVELYFAKRKEKYFKDLLEITGILKEITRKRFDAAKIPIVDLLQIEIASTNVNNNYRNANYQAQKAKNDLMTLVNSPVKLDDLNKPDSFLKIEAKTSEEAIDILINEAIANRPEIKKNLYEQEASKDELRLAKANRIPDLSVTAGPNITTGDDDGFGAFLITRLELPLLYRQKGEIAKAKALQEKYKFEEENIQNQIKLDVINAFNAYILTKEQVKLYESETLVKADELLEKSMKSFRVGKVTFLIPLKALEASINVHLDYLQRVVDYETAISDLERVVGIGL